MTIDARTLLSLLFSLGTAFSAAHAAPKERIDILVDQVVRPVTYAGSGFLVGAFSMDQPKMLYSSPLKVQRVRATEKYLVTVYKKDDKGQWLDIDPKLDGGPGYRDYFDENNGWTYAWNMQHDITGLTDLLGGKKAAEARLDQLFREDLSVRRRDFLVNGSNSTELIGQVSMGNEPSFHIPYLYNYLGAPWKTQRRTRYLLDVWFQDTYHGIPGDEDGGGMTAFVVLSSMGIYQVTPGIPVFTITSPVFEEVAIDLENGKRFTVNAPGASRQVKYIQKAYLDGKELKTPFITYSQIMSGSTLKLELGKYPNKEWGVTPAAETKK